jgi:hypothetical protein
MSNIDKIILSPTYAFTKVVDNLDYQDLAEAILDSPEILFQHNQDEDNSHTTGDRVFPHQNSNASLLKKCLIDFAKEALGKDFKIVDIWAVVLNNGQSTNYHRHSSNSHMFPQEYWSGVVYISAPSGSSRLCLYTQVCNTIENVEKIEPEQGLAVLFNSYVPHQTEKHQSDEPRICVSFNLELFSPNKTLVPDMAPWKNNFD